MLYSGSVSEIVAPYGDPIVLHVVSARRRRLRNGHLQPVVGRALNDVPAERRVSDRDDARPPRPPVAVPRAIAIYERDGGILWRHANMSRRARQLVVSGHSTIDNYDYQFNWIFSQDGAIDGEVLLSGIMNINGTGRTVDTAHADGHAIVRPSRRAERQRAESSALLQLPAGSRRRWHGEHRLRRRHARARARTIPKGELFAMNVAAARDRAGSDVRRVVLDRAQLAVANTHATNALGQFTAYTLVPSAATPAFALAASAPLRTAGFIAHQLWVTPYAPDEQYSAGEFQNLGRDGDGLPRWTARQSIAERYRRRSMVHARNHAHPAAGGLAVHAGASRRFSLASDVILRPQSRARRPAALKTHL